MRWRRVALLAVMTPAVILACSSFDSEGTGDVPTEAGAESAAPDDGSTPDAAAICDPAEVTDAAVSRDCLGNGQIVDIDTSPLHCGRCGHDCLGGTCTNGLCGSVLVRPGGLTVVGEVTATHVYYLSGSDAQRVRLDDGGVDVVAHADGYSVQSFARDGDSLFVATSNGNFIGLGVVASIASGDAGFAPLFQPVGTSQFAVDSKNLYYVSYSSVFSVPKTGAASSSLVKDRPGDGALGPVSRDDELYWIPLEVQSDGGRPGPLTLFVRLADGTIVERVNGVGDPRGLAVDATHVYWADMSTRSVMRVERKGSSPPTVVARWPGTNSFVKALLVAGDRVYWAVAPGQQAGDPSVVYEAPTCAEKATVREVTRPGGELYAGLVADGQNLYYGGLSALWRVAR